MRAQPDCFFILGLRQRLQTPVSAKCDVSVGCSSVPDLGCSGHQVQPTRERRMNSHKHARLTAIGRALLCQRVLEQGWKILAASEAAGVSLRTAYEWLARFRSEDPAGLADRSSRPRSCPRETENRSWNSTTARDGARHAAFRRHVPDPRDRRGTVWTPGSAGIATGSRRFRCGHHFRPWATLSKPPNESPWSRAGSLTDAATRDARRKRCDPNQGMARSGGGPSP